MEAMKNDTKVPEPADARSRQHMERAPRGGGRRSRVLLGLGLLGLVLCAGAGYHFSGLAQASPAGGEEAPLRAAAPALAKVEVETVARDQARTWVEFSGRLAPVDFVAIRPRVGGAIVRVHFTEGAVVKAGDPLFTIDPRPYAAAVAGAEARLAEARSALRLASAEHRRNGRLIDKRLISQSRYDNSENAFRVAGASVKAARAALSQARLNLEYAHIKAPVGGRIGRAEITVGNVIEAGQGAPVLAAIVSSDRFYAEFDIDEQTYLRTLRTMVAGQAPPVALKLQGEEGELCRGVLHAFDNRLDITSGTIRARALFVSEEGGLVAGMYAKILLGSPGPETLLLVPERAIGTNQDQKFVFTVGIDGTVAYRTVRPGRSVEGRREVLAGLAPGEQVVVGGLHRIHAGMAVRPVEVVSESAGTRELAAADPI